MLIFTSLLVAGASCTLLFWLVCSKRLLQFVLTCCGCFVDMSDMYRHVTSARCCSSCLQLRSCCKKNRMTSAPWRHRVKPVSPNGRSVPWIRNTLWLHVASYRTIGTRKWPENTRKDFDTGRCDDHIPQVSLVRHVWGTRVAPIGSTWTGCRGAERENPAEFPRDQGVPVHEDRGSKTTLDLRVLQILYCDSDIYPRFSSGGTGRTLDLYKYLKCRSAFDLKGFWCPKSEAPTTFPELCFVYCSVSYTKIVRWRVLAWRGRLDWLHQQIVWIRALSNCSCFMFSNGSHWWVADGWQRPYYRGWCGSFGTPAGCGGMHWAYPCRCIFLAQSGWLKYVKIQVTWSSPLTWTYIWNYLDIQVTARTLLSGGELHPRNPGRTDSIQLKAWNEMRQASALSIFEWKYLPRRVHLQFFFLSLFSFLFFFSPSAFGMGGVRGATWNESRGLREAEQFETCSKMFQDVPRSYVSICQCWARGQAKTYADFLLGV